MKLKIATRFTYEGFTYQAGDVMEVEDRLAAKILATFQAGEVRPFKRILPEDDQQESPAPVFESVGPTSDESTAGSVENVAEPETQAPAKGGRGKRGKGKAKP